jgi:hypothetical protein
MFVALLICEPDEKREDVVDAVVVALADAERQLVGEYDEVTDTVEDTVEEGV